MQSHQVRRKSPSLRDIVTEIEIEKIIEAMEDEGWVQVRAAERLGISQRVLGYKIKKYGIKRRVKQ